ncbi:hypothetical protein I302_108621 [Kwoniella bestiolae CBS 10118]|uniref:Uncharacterized protein n=1 Tax=Kwoniella bestiolae CBS 10118 TaxID=1296100 RepID=A0A1B9FTL9_9TREE|nr:hypothetical protein I302_07758 [Kwoniella bestiolae CBS 10118]OCF22116.1 hypothetical protein I302_07758 [Kwoniella bestiolae CBS 10118]
MHSSLTHCFFFALQYATQRTKYFPDYDDFPRLFTPTQVPSSSSTQTQPATATQSQTPQPTITFQTQVQSTPSSYQYPSAASGNTNAQSGWGAPVGSYNYNTSQFTPNAFASPPPTDTSPIGYGSPPPSYNFYSQVQTGYNPYVTMTNAYYQQPGISTQAVPQPLSNPNINSFQATNAPCYWGCGLCGKKRSERGYAWCWRCNDSTSGALYSGTGDD